MLLFLETAKTFWETWNEFGTWYAEIDAFFYHFYIWSMFILVIQLIYIAIAVYLYNQTNVLWQFVIGP